MEPFMLKMLPYFLLFMSCVQVFAIEYSRPLPHKSNHWIFNLFTPIAFVFYSALLLQSFEGKKFKNIGLVLISIYFVFSIYNIIFLQGLKLFNNYSYVLGCFVIICTSLLLFVEVAKSENNLHLMEYPVFWVASGLLISHLGDFIIFGLMNMIIKHYPGFTTISFEIIKYLNATLYLLFIIAFLCKPKKQKQYSS